MSFHEPILREKQIVRAHEISQPLPDGVDREAFVCVIQSRLLLEKLSTIDEILELNKNHHVREHRRDVLKYEEYEREKIALLLLIIVWKGQMNLLKMPVANRIRISRMRFRVMNAILASTTIPTARRREKRQRVQDDFVSVSKESNINSFQT